MHLGQDAKFILYVMSDFMSNYVSLRKRAGALAGRAGIESVAHLVEELGIEIDLLVVRAVERPHGRLRCAAGRARYAVEQHQSGRRIGFAPILFLEELGPGIFG